MCRKADAQCDKLATVIGPGPTPATVDGHGKILGWSSRWKYLYFWRTQISAQCRIRWWQPPCQNRAQSIQPFQHNTGSRQTDEHRTPSICHISMTSW